MTIDDTPMPLIYVGSINYHIPDLTLNLISISQLYDSSYSIYFSSTSSFVQDPQS